METPSSPALLIVDDDEFLLRVMARALNRLGHEQVRCEADSARALAMIRAGDAPDVLLLDLNMPGMDGVEFLRLLAETKFAGGVILVSGEDGSILQTADNLARSHRLNVLGHTQKPPVAAELDRLIRLWRPVAESPSAPARSQLPELGEAEIRRGLAEGEFVNHYQPKVEARSGRLCGAETLVRWQHRSFGIIAPDRFIPTIESCGLIDDLTRRVLTGALERARFCLDHGLRLEVAVNVSMDNLNALDFPDEVLLLAQTHGVPPEQITLEVTESQLARDIKLPMDILTRLRLKRVSLSIDDFGTGYSSLAQLMDLPFDELKIDRSFVQAADRDERARLILESSVQLAQKLDMRVVAEGVETAGQLQFVTDLGCDLVQGYYIARPMPAADFCPWAKAWIKDHP